MHRHLTDLETKQQGQSRSNQLFNSHSTVTHIRTSAGALAALSETDCVSLYCLQTLKLQQHRK